MSKMVLKVLMVEDDDGDAHLFRRYLDSDQLQCEIFRVSRVSAVEEAIEEQRPDLILLDLTLPDSSGLETLTSVRSLSHEVPIVLLTGISDEELAVSCLRNGAQDYVVKQQASAESLNRAIRHSIERMLQERALRRSRAEFQALFQHAPYGIFRSTSDGGLLEVNDAFVSMLGYETKGEVISLNLAHDVYADPNDFRLNASIDAEAEHLAESEATWIRRDGKTITVRLTGRAIRGDEGSMAFFELFAEDISDRLALEQQRRQTQKMEAIGKLAGGIAHEINNVLSIILTDTELIQHALPPEMDDLAQDAEGVRQAAIRGGGLVRRLLGFSRKQRLSPHVVPLDARVSEIARTLRGVVEQSVSIECRTDGPQARVRIDAGSVEQILLNLTANARDAMAGGGRLTITTGTTVLDRKFCQEHPGARPGAMGVLKVADTGRGMAEETLQRAFEPFFSTKTSGEGSGLGLSMVYGLVKQQDGFILLQSQPGKGTTVEMFFPQVSEAEDPATRGGARSESSSRPISAPIETTRTVLVVDDEKELLRSAKRALERFGFSVVLASDGAEGLARFRENRNQIDLILTDVVMPNLNGPDFVQRLVQESGTDLPPVLFMSGYSTGEIGDNPLLDGRYPILQKPWEIGTLLATVRDLLDLP